MTATAPMQAPHNAAPHAAPHGAANGAANGAGQPAIGRAAAGGAPSAPYPPPKVGGYGGRTPPLPPRRRPADGAGNGAGNGASGGAAWTPEAIIARLEAAGAAMLALPERGYSTRLRAARLDTVHAALEAYGWQPGRLRPPPPDAAEIGRMDEAMGWLALIPPDRYVLRRIVGARSLVSPADGRHLFAWRRLAALLGADHKAIQRWHAQGVGLIAARLNAGP